MKMAVASKEAEKPDIGINYCNAASSSKKIILTLWRKIESIINVLTKIVETSQRNVRKDKGDIPPPNT